MASHMLRGNRRWAAASFVATVALAGCAVNNPGLPSAETTGSLPKRDGGAGAVAEATGPPRVASGRAKVVMLLPLSGPGALGGVAKAMKQAGELAVINGAGAEFQLAVKDDQGTPDGAKAAAEEAVREGAEIILGPLLAASVEAVAPVAAGARIPMIAFSNDRRVASANVYLLSFMPEQDVERIIGHANAQGRRNFAALLPDDAYGKIVEQAFTSTVGRLQGNVVAIERYSRSGAGMLEATRRVGEALAAAGDGSTAADALLVPGEPETLTSIGPLIAYARIDTTRIKLLGTGGWDAPNIGRDATFVGGWFPAPDQRGWQAFAENFAKTFGSAPPRIASVAFDAVGIASTLASNPPASRFTAAGLTRASGFTGADGQVRFKADGTAERSLAIHEVQAFGSSVTDPGTAAPQRFPASQALGPQLPAADKPSHVN